MTAAKRLDELRQAIRLGLVEEASRLLENKPDPVEVGFFDLLRFKLPDIAKLESKSPAPRLLLLQGIVLNRSRDPLGALAKFQAALQAAGTNPIAQIDVLLETAKAYVWLGNSGAALDLLLQALSLATKKPEQFLVFCRLGDLYAELERWQLAGHYVALAKKCAAGLLKSIYYIQLLDCEARVKLGLGQDISAVLAEYQSRETGLPSYLKFRLSALQVERELAANQISSAACALQKLEQLPLSGVAESFEKTAAQVLSARLDLLRGHATAAIPKLTAARQWYADEDLAVRLTEVRILLAKAFHGDGQNNAAALELNAARDYCQSRALSLQLEKVEGCFADLNLTLYPLTETNRTSSGSWKNRQAYVILEKLGEGGQGAVFRAFDNSRNKIVAFKKLKSRGAEALENLAREVRASNAAAVTNVAQIIACGADEDGWLYMVQEFINGKSLRALMLAGEDSGTLLGYLASASQTLTAIHAKNIIHGDVKPENILVTADRRVVLVDFGLAQNAAQKKFTQLGATARYAPPAFAAKFRSVRWRDHFAVGVMINECAGPDHPLAKKLMRSVVWPFSLPDYSEDWAKLLR